LLEQGQAKMRLVTWVSCVRSCQRWGCTGTLDCSLIAAPDSVLLCLQFRLSPDWTVVVCTCMLTTLVVIVLALHRDRFFDLPQL
jgi:hypothetical protein